ncbi:hypothetical protein [Sutcliffiella horikoshii]|uniref:Uncharacterized protein n=1 Tax=Sutcliffiella horikoshii TaxID=79883 RepID=A0A5D4T2P3_9BACI|nr:hypothetical protein [Sutcliffiella horikoshii]TYS69980.1 hypothetical protein FZC75_15160 [Sutcliffiella horikoshii]
MTDYLIPLITVASTFGAAFAGQFFAHKYARQREKEKHLKESLQNLYSPLVYRILDYLNEECEKSLRTINPYLGEVEVDVPHIPEENTNEMFRSILTFIGENLTYADQNLMMKYEIANKFGEFNYGQDKSSLVSTISSFGIRIELCSAFVSEYLLINKELKTLSKRVRDEIESLYFFSLVVKILIELRVHTLAIDYSLRHKDTIIAGFKIKKGLLNEAETICKRSDNIIDNLEDYSRLESEELEADALHLILELVDCMEMFEPEIAKLWLLQLNEHRDKEEQQTKDIIKKFAEYNN